MSLATRPFDPAIYLDPRFGTVLRVVEVLGLKLTAVPLPEVQNKSQA